MAKEVALDKTRTSLIIPIEDMVKMHVKFGRDKTDSEVIRLAVSDAVSGVRLCKSDLDEINKRIAQNYSQRMIGRSKHRVFGNFRP